MARRILAWLPLPLFLILCIAGFTHRNSLLEEWYLWRLTSEDEEVVSAAVKELHKLGSKKTVYVLFENYKRKFASSDSEILSISECIEELRHQHIEEVYHLNERNFVNIGFSRDVVPPDIYKTTDEQKMELLLLQEIRWLEKQGY